MIIRGKMKMTLVQLLFFSIAAIVAVVVIIVWNLFRRIC